MCAFNRARVEALTAEIERLRDWRRALAEDGATRKDRDAAPGANGNVAAPGAATIRRIR